MVESRWLRWFGPGLAAVATVGAVATTTLGAGDRPWSPRACPGSPGAIMGAVLSRAPADPEEVRAQAWFRLDPLLDGDGALRAQRLVVGLAGSPARLSSELPAESFAAGPFGRIVLVGTDDGSSSRLDAWDVDRSCAYPLAIEGDVIRRATIDHSTGTVV
jgi:hypothetical protein